MALKSLLTTLLLASLAAAQFGPAATSAAGSASSAAASSSTSPTRTTTSAASSAVAAVESSSSSSGIPAPPAESTGCVLHIDHYHCEGRADGTTPTATTSASPTVPSPTESSNCMWHETHWDCFDTPEELQEAQGATDSGECIIHVGHTHGDCSEEQLACGLVTTENYNMGLHVGALFVILVTSGFGVLLPIISGWFRKRNTESSMDAFQSSALFGKGVGLWGNIFFILRHFGTGIIISTAFIHLLFHGFVMFQNKCIGELSYESTAPAISMAAAFITFLLDLLGSRLAHKKHLGSPESPSLVGEKRRTSPVETSDDGCGHHDAAFAAEQNHQVLLLEAGILFHSIMIGVTLGAGTGNGWVTLFIVIIFHQIFEGAALGARIAICTWISKGRALLMALAFTFITPIGIAIGIGVRTSFSQNGKASLLSVGILNSISAGILLYSAFKLLHADFTHGPLRDAKFSKVFAALAAMVVGLIAMSVLGKWA